MVQFVCFDEPSVASIWLYHLLLFVSQNLQIVPLFLESGKQTPTDVISRSSTFAP